MSIQLEAQLPVVQFQKENISRNQFSELFQLRVVPIQVSTKGRTLVHLLSSSLLPDENFGLYFPEMVLVSSEMSLYL